MNTRAVQNLSRPARVRPESLRIYAVVNYLSYVGIATHVLLAPVFFSFGMFGMGVFELLGLVAWLGAYYVNRRGQHGLAISVLMVEVILHATLATMAMGWESGFHYYLIPVIPFAALNDRMRTPAVLIQAIAVTLLYVVLRERTHDLVRVEFAEYLPYIYYANLMVIFVAILVITFYFRVASISAERRMELLASTDALTRLPNRRRMLEHLEGQLARTRRSSEPATLVIADIDNFKRFNDDHGHHCGDEVLVSVAANMQDTLRTQDVVARWGGEEFLLMLPDTDIDGAEIAANKLRERITNSPVVCDGKSLTVTFTFGLAQMAADLSIDQTIRHADAALYRGKEEGRDRVVRWREDFTLPNR